MNITWNRCVQWMENPFSLPLGMELAYEFRPSTSFYVEGYSVHPEYYKLTKEEYWKRRDEVLHQKHTRWNKVRANNPTNFMWQQFTITSTINGNKMVLRMDRSGHVEAYDVTRETVEVERDVYTRHP